VRAEPLLDIDDPSSRRPPPPDPEAHCPTRRVFGIVTVGPLDCTREPLPWGKRAHRIPYAWLGKALCFFDWIAILRDRTGPALRLRNRGPGLAQARPKPEEIVARFRRGKACAVAMQSDGSAQPAHGVFIAVSLGSLSTNPPSKPCAPPAWTVAAS